MPKKQLKKQLKKQVIDYFKESEIQYRFYNEDGTIKNINDVDTIYLTVPAQRVIGARIEICLRFRDEHVYCQAYYQQPIVDAENEEQVFRAARIINYINANLCYDTLFEFKVVLDEETGDVYAGTMLRYEVTDECFLESMSYILDFQAQLLTDICLPIVGYVTKELNFFHATKVAIDYELMGKPIPFIND